MNVRHSNNKIKLFYFLQYIHYTYLEYISFIFYSLIILINVGTYIQMKKRRKIAKVAIYSEYKK